MPRIFRLGSQIGPADPFWVQVREAIHHKALQLGVNLIPIEITDRPESLSAEEQASLLDERMAEELDSLICWNLPDGLILSALQNGLPVVNSSETELRHRLFVSPRGLDDAAHMIGTYLAEALAGAGRLVCVGGLMEPGGENGSTRLAGLREAVRAYPVIELAHIPSSWRSEQEAPQIEAAPGRLIGPIDAIFGLSDSLALLARDAAAALGLTHARTRVAGINGDPLALAAIAEGTMTRRGKAIRRRPSVSAGAPSGGRRAARRGDGHQLAAAVVFLFNIGKSAVQRTYALAALGLAGPCYVFDWTLKQAWPTAVDRLSVNLPSHAGRLLFLSPEPRREAPRRLP